MKFLTQLLVFTLLKVAQEEEQRKALEEWKQSMHSAAANFLSADSAVNLVFRKKRSISKSEILRRARRNAEYFYDDLSADYDFYGVGAAVNLSNIKSEETSDQITSSGENIIRSEAAVMEIAVDAKKEIKKNLMGAMGEVADQVVSPESLLQDQV